MTEQDLHDLFEEGIKVFSQDFNNLSEGVPPYFTRQWLFFNNMSLICRSLALEALEKRNIPRMLQTMSEEFHKKRDMFNDKADKDHKHLWYLYHHLSQVCRNIAGILEEGREMS